jgi:hypothetical protein
VAWSAAPRCCRAHRCVTRARPPAAAAPQIQQYLKTGNILSEEEQDKLAEFFGEGKLPTPQGAPPAAAQPAFAFM